MIQLHGSSIAGTGVTVAGADVDWRQHRLLLRALDIANMVADGKPATDGSLLAIHASGCTAQLSSLVKLDWHARGVLPKVLQFDSMGLDQVTLAYDIDSEGENLHSLRNRLSMVAGNAMKDRINAVTGTPTTAEENPAQLFIVDSLKISGIRIDARSAQNPSRNKMIALNDVTLRDVGRMEGGVTAEEIIDQLSRVLAETVDREVLAQGVIVIKPVVVQTQEDIVVKKRRKAIRESAAEPEPTEPAPAEGKTRKFFKEVGTGFKQVGKGIGNLFKRDK
ncbi:MAG TPA: hypothetical protein PLF22_08710 [Pseudomonadales bacterium]|nr:hypothetical protein [Pseudomonadales bacterium]